MSGNYVPLYRKYRPQTLDTLVGQEHIKKTLTSAIELGKISHAFLFTGPRGTGKTSTARILAKSLNCVNGPTLHPCGECESCRDITNSVPIDVIEIDAASNRKVEDTQNILEKIQYVPVHGKYKIYIIDEVHMLTNHAFNALLKTLEEPPENVIFILATTEVHKVLDTIKSRCQRFDFRRITTDDIVKHLRYISDKENIKITDDALFTIAKNSAGGMRDSISLLDQLSLLGTKNEVTSDDVNSILGRISFDILHNLSEKIISSSPNEAIEIISEIYNSGNEPLQILTNLSEYFKNLLIVKNCKKGLLSELTGLNEPQTEELLKQKDLLETQQLVFILERITYYIKEVKMAANQHLWLEVCIIDLSNMTENTKLIDLQNRLKNLETSGVANNSDNYNRPQLQAPKPPVQKTQAPEQNISVNETVKENAKTVQTAALDTEDTFTPPPMSKKADGTDLLSLWEALLGNINSVPARALLKQMGTPVKIAKDEIIITFKTENFVSQYSNPAKKELLVESAKVLFNNSDTKIVIRLPESGDGNLTEKQNSLNNNISEAAELPKNLPSNVSLDVSPDEKKKTESKPLKVELTEDNKNVKSADNEKPIKDIKNLQKNIESDQEKMILELFDGKYIE